MIHPSLFLRRALQADATFSGIAAAAMLLGGGLLAPLFNLPDVFLRETGLVLIVYAAGVGYLATRSQMSRAAVWTVIAINALWTVASIALLADNWLSPNLLGQAMIVAQAIGVGAFGELQYVGLRRSGAATVAG